MKRYLCVLLSVLVIAGTLCSCSIIKKAETDASSTTSSSADVSAQGTTGSAENSTSQSSSSAGDSQLDSALAGMTVYKTDGNGEYVLGSDGKPQTEKMDISQLAKQFEKSLTQKSSTTKKASPKTGSSGSTKSTAATDIYEALSSKEDLLPAGKQTAKTTLKASVVDSVMNTKNFTLKAKILAGGMEVPTTIAFKNNDFSVTMSMMGFDVRIFSTGGKYYMALPTLGLYDEIDKSEFDSLTTTADAINEKSTYVKTTKVKDGTVTLTCEEYKGKDGTVYKYYFTDKNAWARWEIISNDIITVFKITSFKKGTLASLFQVSKFWRKDPEFSALFKS